MTSATVFATVFSLFLAVDAITDITAFGSTIAVPTDCKNVFESGEITEGRRNYCGVKPENYPRDHVDEYLKSMGFPEHSDESHYETDVTDCGNDVESERERNCCTTTKWETPFVVQSESTLKVVVQTKFFEQRIKTVTCADPGNKCFKDFDIWGYDTQCKPNWGSVQLHVFNSEGSATELVPFIFPVSCSCTFIRK